MGKPFDFKALDTRAQEAAKALTPAKATAFLAEGSTPEPFEARTRRYESMGLTTTIEQVAMHAHESRGIPYAEALERYTRAHEAMTAIRNGATTPELLAYARAALNHFEPTSK